MTSSALSLASSALFLTRRAFSLAKSALFLIRNGHSLIRNGHSAVKNINFLLHPPPAPRPPPSAFRPSSNWQMALFHQPFSATMRFSCDKKISQKMGRQADVHGTFSVLKRQTLREKLELEETNVNNGKSGLSGAQV
jgi:hypothetical protein